MGKANKVKGELIDAVEMTDLVQTLKDVADNKYYTLVAQKYKFRRFGETFVEFFRMMSLTKVQHPLIANDNQKVGIVVVTIEGGFLGEFTSKVIRKAMQEKEKYTDVEFIAIGTKAEERLGSLQKDLKSFVQMDDTGMYEMAVQVKDYIFEQVMAGKLGKIVIVYCFPKSFESQKPRSLQLCPADDLISKQAQHVEIFEKVIEESDPKQIISFLTNLWITTRLYEIFVDSNIASAAAQANFLEDSVDKMKKERDKTKVKYRKAKKGDIDKSLRETFSARMMTTK